MNKKLVPITYVEQVSELPNLPPIVLEAKDPKLLFLMESSFWVGLSLWLENKVSGQALPLEALEEPAMWFEPYADYYAALFRLAIETHSRTTCLDLLNFNSPADLWWHCISTTAQQDLEYTGLFGTPPRVIGKKEAFINTREICQQLRKRIYQPDPFPSIATDPEGLLIVEAQKLAIKQTRFRHRHFLPFVKTLLDTARTAYECKHLQSAYILPGEKLLITGLSIKLAKHKQ